MGEKEVHETVTPIHRWEVYEFPWGSAVKEQRTGKWNKLYIKPNAQEIDVSNLDVELHENGIEFI